MESTNHRFGKENDLPNLMIMLHVNLQGCTTTRNCWNVFLRDYEVAVLMSSLRALSGSDRAACRASLVAQRNQSSPGEKKKGRCSTNVP